MKSAGQRETKSIGFGLGQCEPCGGFAVPGGLIISSDSALSDAGPQTRWGVVALAVGAGVVAATQLGKVPPVLPDIRAEFGMGMIGAGAVASTFHAIASVFAIVVGIFADGWGHRRVLSAGLIFLGLGSLAGAFATTDVALLAARFFEGCGFVAVIVASPSLIANACNDPRKRDLALGIWGAYFPAGWGMMAIVAPLFVAAWGWRSLWIVGVLMMAAFLVLTLAMGRISDSGRQSTATRSETSGSVASVLRLPGPWLLAASFATFSLMWVGLMVWLPTYFIEEEGYSRALAAVLTALVVMCEISGNVSSGWLLARGVARWKIIAVSLATMGILSVVIFSTPAPGYIKIACAAIFSAIGGLIPGATLAGAPLHAPSPRLIGIVNGVLVQGANVGNFLGPIAMGAAVALLGGWQSAGWLPLVIGGLGIVLALGIRRVEERL